MMLLVSFMCFLTWAAGGDYVVEAPTGSVFREVPFIKGLRSEVYSVVVGLSWVSF
jgi:hypothetical protein